MALVFINNISGENKVNFFPILMHNKKVNSLFNAYKNLTYPIFKYQFDTFTGININSKFLIIHERMECTLAAQHT